MSTHMMRKILVALIAFACLSAPVFSADPDPKKVKADEEKKKADEAKKAADEKKKADDAKKATDDKAKTEEEIKKRVAEETKKKLAEEAKKKLAEEKKKKAEEAKKHAEEVMKKQDDPANWKPRDFTAVKATNTGFCVYIKDAGAKKNTEAALLEGKDILGNADARLKLRAFQRVKIKNDGSDAKGWPADWLKRAENGALLVVVCGDGQQVLFFDTNTTKNMTASAFQAALEPFLKRDTELKASAARQAKEEFERKKDEAARAAAAAVVPGLPSNEGKIPGLDGTPKKVADKPKSKDPQDE